MGERLKGLMQRDTPTSVTPHEIAQIIMAEAVPTATLFQWPVYGDPASEWERELIENRGDLAQRPQVPWATGRIMTVAELLEDQRYLG